MSITYYNTISDWCCYVITSLPVNTQYSYYAGRRKKKNGRASACRSYGLDGDRTVEERVGRK